jgi:glycosyltransferase involved in cell wall biosynthesis
MSELRVTIGLPVYNGENFIEDTINSILNQQFQDFELIISDNASTDRTESICREFARGDNRIQYYRNDKNIGAAPNFNNIVPKARGEYFKWMAHDDVIMPEFLNRCVEVLDNDTNAVLACPSVQFINANGDLLEKYASPFRTADPDPVVRFRETLYGHRCFEVFGLIRLNELKKTNLIGCYNHGDGVLLSHLALLGKFAEITDGLFLSRRHEKQSMYMFGITRQGAKSDFDAYARWFDQRNIDGVPRSYSRRLADYFFMIRSTLVFPEQRRACYRSLLKWLLFHWRIIAGEWKRSIYHSLGFDSRPRYYKA